MKKITLTMIAVFALCGVSMAQTRGERGTRSNQQHNPEMMAERMTDRMAKEYELDDKQKAELLELNKEFADKTEMPRMRPHRQGRPQAKAQPSTITFPPPARPPSCEIVQALSMSSAFLIVL